MLRSVAAGLMCLGLATLGVTALRGQEAGQSDLIAEDGSAGEGLVEIQLGSDDGIVADDLIIRSDDGRVVEKIGRATPRLAAAQFRIGGGPTVDTATRESLEKIVAGLKDEAKRLESDGRKEEAEQKRQSIRAIEQLLSAPRRAGVVFRQPRVPDGAAAEEIKKLHERIDDLRREAGRQPHDGEAHAKIQKEIADAHRKLAELHQRGGFAGILPGMPGQPGMPPMVMGGFGTGGFPGAAPGQFFAFQQGGMPAEAQVMAQKAAALTNAANQLQQAGLEDQARELRKQAEKLQAAAEKLRAEAQAAPGGRGPGGFGVFAGGQPGDLQKAIRELQEQVQQLRKEVGELRELLQQRRT
jgi:hypothetical protein